MADKYLYHGFSSSGVCIAGCREGCTSGSVAKHPHRLVALLLATAGLLVGTEHWAQAQSCTGCKAAACCLDHSFDPNPKCLPDPELACESIAPYFCGTIISDCNNTIKCAPCGDRAKYKNLCCDMGSGGACVAQNEACSATVGVALSDLPEQAGCDPSGCAVATYTRLAKFPAGTDGHAFWSTATPRVGFCLLAPNPDDPQHAQPTEPIGCIQLSISAGIGSSIAQFTVPKDPRWDGYELCYGAQLTANSAQAYTPTGDPAPCANLNDLLDPGVAPTPVSGSCCNPAEMFKPEDVLNPGTWTVGIGQEIPGVPPPEVYVTVDGGLHAYPLWDAGDQARPSPKGASTISTSRATAVRHRPRDRATRRARIPPERRRRASPAKAMREWRPPPLQPTRRRQVRAVAAAASGRALEAGLPPSCSRRVSSLQASGVAHDDKRSSQRGTSETAGRPPRTIDAEVRRARVAQADLCVPVVGVEL
jgi:hypothetical protein